MPPHFALLLCLFSIAVAQSGMYTTGNCYYINGKITEDGITRKATPEEEAKVAEFGRAMDEWGRRFGDYMSETMSHMFDRNYVAPPEPAQPQAACICSNPKNC